MGSMLCTNQLNTGYMHCICIRILKKKHKSLPTEDSLHSYARAYTPWDFEYYMSQLNHLSTSIRHELEEVGR